ncbi:MAG: nitrogenase [Methanobrevibacter sp.]|jgi:nitrogenase molybdenum-iron protein alpha chain|nr:nitrogenase [Candidatus Methanovirga aequatorialis]
MSNEEYDFIDLNKNTCPSREQRANGTNVYYGKASKLSKNAKEGKVLCSERKFQQSGGCVLNFYLSVRVPTIRDAVTIFNSPVGCSASALGYRELYRGVPVELGRPAQYNLNWLTTNLQQEDVIYGANEKLKETILEAEHRYSPKAIFILTSCTTGIIGEDIEGAVNSVQPKVKAKIVPVHCEGVRSRLVQTGYDAFWHGVLKYLVKQPRKKQEDLVNVASMLSYTWQDRLEIKRLLGKLDLRVNFIPEFATVDQFEILSEAALTAPICPTYTDYLSKGLEKEFNVPYFLYPSPTGIKNTDEWLRQIGKFTNKEDEVEDLIKEEHKIWKPKMETIQEKLIGLHENGEKIRVLGSLGQGRLVNQMPFFDELGLQAPAAMAQDFDDLLIEFLDDIIEKHGDFDLMVNTFQAAEQANITSNIDPDLTLTCPFQGGSWERDNNVTRIHSLRGDADPWSTQSGYAGAVAFGNFLLQAFKNRSYNKTLSEKTPKSYKDWWYQQPDPLYYVEKGGSK